MRRRKSRFGNKRVAAGQLGSADIAIFAEDSTLFTCNTIIPDTACTHDFARMIVQENVMKRRDFLKLSLSTAAVATLSSHARAQAGVKEIRIGYQKNGVLVIARQQANLENHFKPLGIEVKWVELSSGTPMME